MSFNLNSNVIFYGPPGSGKTSMLRSFFWTVSNNSRAISHSEDLMDIRLKLKRGGADFTEVTPEDCYLEGVKGTETGHVAYSEYIMQRIPRKTLDTSNAHIAHRQKLSSASHGGILRDRKGADQSALAGSQNYTISEGISGALTESIRTSHGIIVLLDGDPTSGYRADDMAYSDFLKPIKNLDSKYEDVPRHIAFCVSKVDQDPALETLEPGELQHYFGMADFQKDLNEKHFETRWFCVSTWGFWNGKPNVTDDSEYINRQGWQPHRVHEPFFWIYEGIEQAKLKLLAQKRSLLKRVLYPKSQILQDYIPYDVV